MAVKLSLSGSRSSSSSSSSSFRNNPSFQALRRAVSEHSPCTTASTFGNTTTTTTATIITPSSTIASRGEPQTGSQVSPQLDAAALPPSALSPATAPAVTSCSSPPPTTTVATASISARPLFLPPLPEDVIKLLLSTTTYIYDSLTKLIDTNNALRKSTPRIPGDKPICRADMLRGTACSSRTAIGVEGSSSTSCPNGMTHDALHIVNSHRAFARAIKAEIAKLSAALAYFSLLSKSQSSRLRSFLPSLPTSTRSGGLRVKVDKKRKYTRGEKSTAWSDIKKIICMYDWLWTYSYSASVKSWQEVIWACAVVTGVHGAGGLEGVNARMRDYGIAHAGVVDRLCVAYWPTEQEAERGQAQTKRVDNQKNTTIQGEAKKEVIVVRKMVKIDGKLVQADPGVVVAEEKEEVGFVKRWKVELRALGGVVAVGLKIKVLGKQIKGKEEEKCKEGKGKGKVEETIAEDLFNEGYEKAMWE